MNIGTALVITAIIIVAILVIRFIRSNWSAIAHIVGTVVVIALAVWGVAKYWPSDNEVRNTIDTVEEAGDTVNTWVGNAIDTLKK